jgi:hypothetical protein
VTRVVQEWVQVFVLVANAGGGRGSAHGRQHPYSGALAACHIDDLFGTVAGGGYAHYGAEQAAIAASHPVSGARSGPFGITANCIPPGVIATGGSWRGSFREHPKQSRPRRVGRPTAARDGRGLRQGGRVPRDRFVGLRDRSCYPDRWRLGPGIIGVRLGLPKDLHPSNEVRAFLYKEYTLCLYNYRGRRGV